MSTAKAAAKPIEAHETRDPSSFAHVVVLIMHLVQRDIATKNRFSVIGAAWPLLRQLAQLGVLVVAFSAVLDLGIDNYPAFVFCGLVGWSWFLIGLGASSQSVRERSNLAMRPGFPTLVLPVVATLGPFVDVLFALPVLAILLFASNELGPSALLLLPLLALQGVLMVGLGWIFASASVFLRDVPNLVNVSILMLFYVTPVFFEVSRVPEKYQWLIRLNPMAVILEADRSVLLGTPFPPLSAFLSVVAVSFCLFGAGLMLFRRLAPAFADEL